jgi:tetratricopeptide (TPR) repeat protein
VADLLRNARQRIDAAFLDQPPLRVELLSIVGSSANAIQDFDTAQAVLDGAMKEASAAFGPEDPRTLHARVLRLSVLRYRGQTDAMRAELEDLLPMLRRHPAGEDLILAIENHAHLAIDEGRYVDAESYAQEAVELATQELGERAAYTTALSSLLVATYRYNKKYDLAYPMARRTFERTLELVQNDSLHPSLIDARVAYGRALADVGQLAAGIEQLERATGDARTLLGPSSAMVGFFSGQLAWLLVDDGNLRDAVSYADEHLSVLTKIAAPGSFTYASTLFNHGAIVLAARQTQRAVEELQQAQQMLAGTLGPTHDLSRRAQVEYALALAHAGRFAEARRQLDERLAPDPSGSAGMDRALYVSGVLDRLEENHDAADAALQAALGAIQPGAKASLMRMRILVEIGLNCLEQGADRAALDALQEAIALSDQLERQVSPTRADAMVAVGRIRLQQSDRDEAIAILRAAHEFWGGFDPENRWAGVAALWLGTAYREAGMSSEAGAALARARRVLARSPLPADAEMLAHNGKFIQ